MTTGKRGPNRFTLERRRNREKVSEEAIEMIYEFWKTTHKRRAALDEKTRDYIGNAIHFYGMEDCRKAIIGIQYSDFHMGRNDRNTKYISPLVIFKNPENVERFIALCPEDHDGGGRAFVDPENPYV